MAEAFFECTYVFDTSFNIACIRLYCIHTYVLSIRIHVYMWIMSSLFAEFRYNVTCGWLSFVGLSMFDVDCYCWLLGV